MDSEDIGVSDDSSDEIIRFRQWPLQKYGNRAESPSDYDLVMCSSPGLRMTILFDALLLVTDGSTLLEKCNLINIFGGYMRHITISPRGDGFLASWGDNMFQVQFTSKDEFSANDVLMDALKVLRTVTNVADGPATAGPSIADIEWSYSPGPFLPMEKVSFLALLQAFFEEDKYAELMSLDDGAEIEASGDETCTFRNIYHEAFMLYHLQDLEECCTSGDGSTHSSEAIYINSDSHSSHISSESESDNILEEDNVLAVTEDDPDFKYLLQSRKRWASAARKRELLELLDNSDDEADAEAKLFLFQAEVYNDEEKRKKMDFADENPRQLLIEQAKRHPVRGTMRTATCSKPNRRMPAAWLRMQAVVCGCKRAADLRTPNGSYLLDMRDIEDDYFGSTCICCNSSSDDETYKQPISPDVEQVESPQGVDIIADSISKPANCLTGGSGMLPGLVDSGTEEETDLSSDDSHSSGLEDGSDIDTGIVVVQ